MNIRKSENFQHRMLSNKAQHNHRPKDSSHRILNLKTNKDRIDTFYPQSFGDFESSTILFREVLYRFANMAVLFRMAAIVLLLTVDTTHGFSMSMSSVPQQGSAAKPYEKQKVAVFGTGGYLAACTYGFLQRAGSLYGTGIAGIGAPRAIVATAAGSAGLNSVLSKNFVLAQADESFIRCTDMTSAESIANKLSGFDAAIIGTRYCFKTNIPVTAGTYGKSPNDKTKEFFMDQPRGRTSQLMDDPEYSYTCFYNTLEACRNSNKMKHLVVVETDAEFETEYVGDKYIALLEEAGIPYTYIRPVGRLDNIENFTFKTGIRSDLRITRANSLEELLPVSDGVVYREHLAAVCVQALMTLSWEENKVIQVEQSDYELEPPNEKTVNPAKEWCVNSGIVMNSMAEVLV